MSSDLDWAGYLTNFYKPLQGILALHQITVSQAGVFTRKNLGDESTSVKLMKANKPLDGDLPAVLPQKGLDAKRQWYLYEAIRPFCLFGTVDLVAPAPTVPKSGNFAEIQAPQIPTKHPQKGRKRKTD